LHKALVESIETLHSHKYLDNMTRINVGIDPSELSTQHLLAEHREIKRVPNMVRTGKAKLDDIPETFRLGPGHVKFFYNKLGYLLDRYSKIYRECKKRGFNVQSYASAWSGIPAELLGQYQPTQMDIHIIRERIKSKTK